MIEYRPIERGDLDEIVALCEIEGWTSFPEDPERAWRALTAPGVHTLVAVEPGGIAGFVQMQSDGEIQAHLSLVLVVEERRRRGIASGARGSRRRRWLAR